MSNSLQDQLNAAIQVERLVDTAVKIIGIPSPTLSAKGAADKLAEILEEAARCQLARVSGCVCELRFWSTR